MSSKELCSPLGYLQEWCWAHDSVQCRPGTRGSQRVRERSLRVLQLCQRQPRMQVLVPLRKRTSHRPTAQDCVWRGTAEGPQAGETLATVSRESPLTFWCNADISILPANSSLRSWSTENWADWDVWGWAPRGGHVRQYPRVSLRPQRSCRDRDAAGNCGRHDDNRMGWAC